MASQDAEYVPPEMNIENSPAPITELTPELLAALRKRSDAVLSYLVSNNSISTFFKESNTLASFRNALNTEDYSKLPENLYEMFNSNVELSEYKNYQPFVSRFFEKPCKASDVENLMAPGMPYFIAHSSGTSGGATKHFPKYQHPKHMSTSTAQTMAASNPVSKTGGKNCVVYSLGYREVVAPIDEKGEPVTHMPVCLMSSGTIRMHTGMYQPKDQFYQKIKIPINTSPLAASFIPDYKSFLFMHGLFALAEPKTELINTMFSTIFRDLCRVLIEQYDVMVDCIEKGTIPDLPGTEHVHDNLMQFWKADPERAKELREITNNTNQVGWLRKLWPGLSIVVAISSGSFGSVLPEITHYMGPEVNLRTLGINCSEAFLALAYDAKDKSLYKVVGSDDIIEYLDIDAPENASGLSPAWEAKVGKKYEVVLTTRDGFWRYRLGDVVEIVGYDPRDGQPIIHYLERRNVHIRLANEITTEAQLSAAVSSVSEELGNISEFCVMPDYRYTTPAYAFYVEPQNDLPGEASDVPAKLHRFLQSANENYLKDSKAGKLAVPSVHVLKPGAFGEYREWKIKTMNISSGQVKVPLVVWDDVTRKWLEERRVQEVKASSS